MITGPTGTGKSITTTHLINSEYNNNKSTFLIQSLSGNTKVIIIF